MIDLVDSGSTYGHLMKLLTDWAKRDRVDLPAMRRHLRFIGITWRSKPSPNTFRWQQHAPWLDTFPRIVAKNVSIPGSLWSYLGNAQPKVALAHPPWRWADQRYSKPPRYETNLQALRLALKVFEAGSSEPEREALASELAQLHEMRQSWLRRLVSDLRGLAV
ncbi:MAG: hypothetical protein MI919_12025 [Holophagales bacterium]|nr:hypothetical protein [Holophagales bacterium]